MRLSGMDGRKGVARMITKIIGLFALVALMFAIGYIVGRLER